MVNIRQVEQIYNEVVKELIVRGLTITTMESCTSGLIASLITDTEGASEIFRGSFVTYSNDQKIRCGVDSDIIRQYGVYSSQTAEAMAEAAKLQMNSDISIGITGTFSNADPNNADSVPGLVYLTIDFINSRYTVCLNIPEQENRLSYKLYVAEFIGKKLIEILGN